MKEAGDGRGKKKQSTLTNLESYARFHRIRQRIQPILNLAGLLTNGIEGAGVVGRIGSAGPMKAILSSKIVARRATNLSHDSLLLLLLLLLLLFMQDLSTDSRFPGLVSGKKCVQRI